MNSNEFPENAIPLTIINGKTVYGAKFEVEN
jgi:hypothetical protein